MDYLVLWLLIKEKKVITLLLHRIIYSARALVRTQKDLRIVKPFENEHQYTFQLKNPFIHHAERTVSSLEKPTDSF